MGGRRRLMLALNLMTLAGVAWAAALVANAGGWAILDIIIFLCVVAATPWNAIGFWNSLVGFLLIHASRSGLVRAAPFLADGEGDARIRMRTAILMTLRNEDPRRALSRLRAVKAALDATPSGGQFDYFLLSDTSDPAVAIQEEAAFAEWQRDDGPRGLFYRRRAENTGFKAGNVREFCETAGKDYEFFLPLDADSLMGARAILRMVRIMQAHPRLGLLQSLVVGMPSASAFARIFQFGMRHGMRCYTLGATWWAGDCGPFWGHNALVRLAPFRDQCRLPDLPGGAPLGGPILSHDQVEAVLMRHAGYEVRVLPVECESYEENPPTLPDFLARDQRWCLGNMQYLKLLVTPGLLPSRLHPMSRFQLVWAVLMFASVPTVPLALLLVPFAAAETPVSAAPLAAGLFLTLLFFSLAPKLAGLLDVAVTRGMVARYGGAGRFTLSALLEVVFSFLMGPICALMTTGGLARLSLGMARGSWNGQARDAHRISWRAALRGLWLPTVFSALVLLCLALLAPALLPWLLPLVAGGIVAVPIAVLTADPRVGAFMARHRLCALPEEQDPPEIFRILAGEPVRDLEQAA
ncbi:MAG: glucan biosynthesis glucosyltransferase H [Rhizobiales bacterium 32-66-8]|nr:MAG: glucan biosynthesis glucosyltransferase H [Rhizobiales bacterium 32-66-8]